MNLTKPKRADEDTKRFYDHACANIFFNEPLLLRSFLEP
jgi:hypothetical protein